MIKYLTCILSLLIFVACKDKQAAVASDSSAMRDTVIKTDTLTVKTTPNLHNIFKPYTLIDDFVVTDTGYYDFEVGGGFFEVIKRDGGLIDTIDRDFGIQKLSSGDYIYQKVKGLGKLPDDASDYGHKLAMQGEPANYTVLNKNNKQVFNKLAPNFDNYFSSASVINGDVYYWKIEKLKSGNNHISAAKFDPINKKTISHYLFDDYIETDASIYFDLPEEKNGIIFFRDYEFDTDFKRIK